MCVKGIINWLKQILKRVVLIAQGIMDNYDFRFMHKNLGYKKIE